ncbi:MAG: transposase domain-containing protein [Planctomycetota bacterium]
MALRRLRGSGNRAAAIYSLACTCSLLGIEPQAYLKDVLQKIAEGADRRPSRRASGRLRAARPPRTEPWRRHRAPLAAATGQLGGPGAYVAVAAGLRKDRVVLVAHLRQNFDVQHRPPIGTEQAPIDAGDRRTSNCRQPRSTRRQAQPTR